MTYALGGRRSIQLSYGSTPSTRREGRGRQRRSNLAREGQVDRSRWQEALACLGIRMFRARLGCSSAAISTRSTLRVPVSDAEL